MRPAKAPHPPIASAMGPSLSPLSGARGISPSPRLRGEGRGEGLARLAFAGVALLLLAGASASPKDEGAEAETYAHCTQMAQDDPAAALQFADAWRKRGGEHPALHCHALALIGLKRYAEGAAQLDALAQAMTAAPTRLRADVLDQEGQAWLLAGDAGRAWSAADASVKLAPDDPNLLVDRAEAAGVGGHYDMAVADLDRVLQSDPARVDALVYRASAERKQGRLAPALADAEKALRLQPDLAPALLERGNIRGLTGDRAGAREDWLRILDTAPQSPEARTARANLAALDAELSGGARPKAAAGPGSSP
jgi:tetratricopeptide (TPR) repeat protein